MNDKNKIRNYDTSVTSITYKQLREEAKNLGIPRYSQMRKGELYKAISYRTTHPKVRFGVRPKTKLIKVSTSPVSRSNRTKKIIPVDKPLLSTKTLHINDNVANISELEIKNRKEKHKKESEIYLKKNNIRSVSDYLQFMMMEYDPESRASIQKAKKLAGYLEYITNETN